MRSEFVFMNLGQPKKIWFCVFVNNFYFKFKQKKYGFFRSFSNYGGILYISLIHIQEIINSIQLARI